MSPRKMGVRYVDSSTKWGHLQRVRIRASKYGEKVMAKDMIIKSPPEIFRFVRVTYTDAGIHHTSAWIHYKWSKNFIHNIRSGPSRRHVTNLTIKKVWIVQAEGGPGNIWQHLEYAKAERDALNYQHAKWIMARGTKAEGLGT